jgi:hypothetical protein
MTKQGFIEKLHIWQRGLSVSKRNFVQRFIRVGVYGPSPRLFSLSVKRVLPPSFTDLISPLDIKLYTISDIENIRGFSKQRSFLLTTGYRQKAQNNDKLLI